LCFILFPRNKICIQEEAVVEADEEAGATADEEAAADDRVVVEDATVTGWAAAEDMDAERSARAAGAGTSAEAAGARKPRVPRLNVDSVVEAG